METLDTRTTYEPLRIPRRQTQGSPDTSIPKNGHSISDQSGDTRYYEIEYDACPIPGVGKFVLKSQKTAEPQRIAEPQRDEIRDLFSQMRDIARGYRSSYSVPSYSRFYNKRAHLMNSAIFYKQALFLQDYTDDYEGNASFSQYFPYYQNMEHEQLRTYFSWRTKVRSGTVLETSVSYAFLYLYELLGNIGVACPSNGLDKILSFWKAYRSHDATLDQYVLRWLKDYHIYYELPHTFSEFIEEHRLTELYPPVVNTTDDFDLFCSLSKYDIKKSRFYTEDNASLIKECFYHVLDTLKQTCVDCDLSFDESLFKPTKKLNAWTPFRDALFFPAAEQQDRTVVLSENEMYICSQNSWSSSTTITSESGKQLIGFLFKQMESVLRAITKFKYKLTANSDTLTHPLVLALLDKGYELKEIVSTATREFYRKATETVVKVDLGTLSHIRKEALETQEKLIVPEQSEVSLFHDENRFDAQDMKDSSLALGMTQGIHLEQSEGSSVYDEWASLKNSLSEVERGALLLVLQGIRNLKEYADTCGIMKEVLIDQINEKAMDTIGDSLLDEDCAVYDDYKDQIRKLMQ